MQVTSLMLMLLFACFPHTCGAAFLMVPSKLQLFEYESVSFACLGFDVSAGVKVTNVKQSVPDTIRFALVTDSGEYWCEGGGGERSPPVSITVSAGPVVLESPVLPVTEGADVTLSCRNKMASSNLTAHFYKDGVLVGSSSTGNMSLHGVSRSDGGRYTCATGAGESAQSPLTVLEQRPNVNGSGTKGQRVSASHRPTSSSDHIYFLLWSSIAVALTLWLTLVGLLGYKKRLLLLQTEPSQGLREESRGDAGAYGSAAVVKRPLTHADDDGWRRSLMRNHSSNPHGGEEAGVSSFQCPDYSPVRSQNRYVN